jgi:hypothetical protein
MGAPRRWAASLLRAAVRLVPEQSRAWAQAMLGELDFIEGDWAAFFWAVGSLTAILRHAATAWRAWFNRANKKAGKEAGMNDNKPKKALVVGMGVLCILALAGCAAPMTHLLPGLFPQFRHVAWPHFTAAIAVPEAAIIAAAVLLWRKQGPVATGVLLTALAVGLHVAVHIALH